MLAELPSYLRIAPPPARLDVLLPELHRPIYFSPVVMIECKSGMYVSQSQVVFLGDLDGSSTLMLVPDDDVLHRDPVPRNPRLSTYDFGRNFNMSIQSTHRALFMLPSVDVTAASLEGSSGPFGRLDAFRRCARRRSVRAPERTPQQVLETLDSHDGAPPAVR